MYFAVSVDTPETNRQFAEQVEADYVMLSDPQRTVAAAYGVLGADGQYAQRWTFYIGPDGRILHVDRKVSAASAGPDMVARLRELGVARRK